MKMKTMKKLFLAAIILVNSISIFAQTLKGDFFLSGSTGLALTSDNVKTVYDGETYAEYHQNSFSLSPTIGYFVIDNLAIGLTSSMANSTQKDVNGNKVKASSLVFAPRAYYFFQYDEKIRPFADMAIGFSSDVKKSIPKTGYDTKDSSSGIMFGLGGGVFYFLSKNISVGLGLHYTFQSTTDGDNEDIKLKNSGIVSDISIGIFF